MLVSAAAFADDSGEWKTVLQGPVVIKNREIAGSNIKEVWAESDLDASLFSIQGSLLDINSYRGWMPYVKESRGVGEKQTDGSFYSYIMLDLPVVGKRDYILRTWVQDRVGEDSKGLIRYHWQGFPEFVPARKGVDRIKLNIGSWEVKANADGKSCHAIYKFAVDPGGWLPGFAVNIGNERGVVDTFKALEKEAQRRREENAKKAPAMPSPTPAPPKAP